MRLRGSVPIPAALVLAVLAAGCAPGASAGGSGSPSAQEEADAANRIVVQVRNTVVPPTSLTVYAVDAGGGTRRILGSVSPNGQSTLTFNPAATVSTYRLGGAPRAGRSCSPRPSQRGWGRPSSGTCS